MDLPIDVDTWGAEAEMGAGLHAVSVDGSGILYCDHSIP